MSLWILERTENSDWDEFSGMVVRAGDEKAARKIANRRVDDEDEPDWTDPELVSCKRLLDHGEDRVILANFKAG